MLEGRAPGHDGPSGSAVVAGAVAGAGATVAMSAVMALAARAGLMGQHPPERIAEEALRAGGADRSTEERAEGPLAAVLHLGFGAATGAAYALLPASIRRAAPPPISGAVFGSLVWLVSYWGWVPALRILPPVPRDRPDRQVSMLVAHWVFGAALAGSLDGRLDRPGPAGGGAAGDGSPAPEAIGRALSRRR